jgi:hypothetical protein
VITTCTINGTSAQTSSSVGAPTKKSKGDGVENKALEAKKMRKLLGMVLSDEIFKDHL